MTDILYIIVEDDALSRNILNNYLQDYPFLKNLASFESAAGVEEYIKKKKVDILFSDIKMPGGPDGLSLVKSLKDKVPYFVLLTSFPDYALDSYELEVNDYILKPIDEEKIEKAIKKIKTFFETKEKAELYKTFASKNTFKIKVGLTYRYIDINEIIYLISLKDYTKIFTTDGKSYVVYGNLSTTLKDDRFTEMIRIHRCHAINKNHLRMMKAMHVVLSDDTILPIGRIYKENLK